MAPFSPLHPLKKGYKLYVELNLYTTMTYIEEIRQNDILTDEQEHLLAERIHKGDQMAVAELVKHNLRYVLSIASQYTGKGVDYDDLVSEGNIGLLKAANRFSPYPGKRFVKFAAPIVRDAMEKYIENHSGLYKIPRREVTTTEMRRSHPVSVDAPIPVGSKNNFNLLNLLENFDAPYADHDFTQANMEEYISSLFNGLNERERKVLSYIYGIGQDRHSMAEVGALMDLNRERVRQIRDKALRKLRKARRQMEMK